MFFNDLNNRTRQDVNRTCPNKIIHTIVAGDTLFDLANRHNTTVGQILMLNPGTDIYNLQIGAKLVICPGTPVAPVPPIGTFPPITPIPPIGTLPPITPAPPIAPLPPVIPIPPIGPILPEAVRELIMCVLNWVQRYLGDNEVMNILDSMDNERRRY